MIASSTPPGGRLVFVTGTGTEVGKTITTAALARAAALRGLTVQTIKPVQTGCAAAPDGTPIGSDADLYREACPNGAAAVLDFYPVPASPHYAAGLVGKRLSADSIAAAIRARQADADITFIEGAGGLLVPLNEAETFADVIAKLPGVQVVLVAANILGAINQVLLTLEALRARGLEPAALVANQSNPAVTMDDTAAAIARDNLSVYRTVGKIPVVATLSHHAALYGEPVELADAKADNEKTRHRDSDRADAWDDASAELQTVVDALTASPNDDNEEEEDVLRQDAAHLWHPYAKTHPPTPVWEAVRTAGTRITLRDGRELVDGMSSWWSAIHGYNHPALMAAIREQVATMPHVMFGGLTHRPAAELARRLVDIAPRGLGRVFFADSGSVAMEVALKMAIQYQHATGHPEKRRFLTPRGGYHGDTIGAMSVCDPVTGMHGLFAGVVPEQIFFDKPACPFHGEFQPESLASLEEAFRLHADGIAAVVLEPVVQGAGGMWFYRPEYLTRLRELCDRHGAILIHDEIATGFGRTGKLFASEWAGVTPDIMAVGKALTGGVMTLSAVLAKDAIAEAISLDGVFMHGPTFMANPLACRVALASLDELFTCHWRDRVRHIEQELAAGLEPLRPAEGVHDVRVLGAIGVVEMTEPVAMDRLMAFFVDQTGAWLRPFGRLIYTMPPYIATDDDIRTITTAIQRAVKEKAWR
ncbi:MAG: adenosylmethionine--8-amino-7-oxononanoate transaminase [Planctomycetes bacterium]|nr:adenosylmethionine--8-amino-7-oxononanoate transaminase [Planctomycetota bacterium]